MFEILFGRALNLSPVNLAICHKYLLHLTTAIYHAEFGIGDPVTRYSDEIYRREPDYIRSSNSLATYTHESYITHNIHSQRPPRKRCSTSNKRVERRNIFLIQLAYAMLLLLSLLLRESHLNQTPKAK